MPSPGDAPSTLPTGTVTFMFTDIEGSTRLLQRLGSGYPEILEAHHRLLREAIEGNDGISLGSEGDSVFAVFASPVAAVTAALAGQRALAAAEWPDGVEIRVRIGLHTGEGILGGQNYVGLDVHRAARISAASHGGQILVSDATETLIARALPERVTIRDLGEHRLKDLDRPEHLFQVAPAELTQDFPPVRSMDVRRTNLPHQLTSFIGRAREVARVKELLTETQLLTLTGPGGTGKTRLAIQAAAALQDEFADGCFFVPLSPISDPSLLLSTVAQVLGVQEAGDRPMAETLHEYLEPKELLLVLDNFEQILEAGPAVGDLVSSNPRLKIVVTTRAVLHVHGEHEFPVPPLALPEPGEHPSAESLGQYEAVALFIQRARAMRPDFEVTNENAPAVAEICARLDGLPLAIELAAARVKFLEPDDVLARLSDRLSLLRGGAKDLPTRQQTLRDAIAWSYDLLDEDEQALFRLFSVFVGGWTLDAAEAVMDGDADVFEGVASLVDKSLVRRLPQELSGSRFSMLMTIREFAWERLLVSPEADEVRRRHAELFLGLTEEAEPNLTGPEHMTWLDRIERDHDNIRSALRWSVEKDRAEVGLRMGGALWRFWHLRGHFTEGRAWITELLVQPSAQPRSAARAKGLNGLAGLVYWQGDYDLASTYWNESLEIWKELGERGQIAEVLYSLAYIATIRAEFDRAMALFDESTTLFREVGDKRGEGNARMSLGMGYQLAGDLEAAALEIKGALPLVEEAGDTFGTANALGMLGRVASEQGQFEEATGYMVRTLRMFMSLGDMSGIAFTLDDLAAVAIGKGRFERAIVLTAAAQNIRDTLGGAAPTALVVIPDARGAARGALDEEAIEAASAKGKAMTLERAVAYALEERPPSEDSEP
jgi:predicted ATPase/class 3 adenylate cyclase